MTRAPAIHELNSDPEPGRDSGWQAAVDRADALALAIGPRAAAVAFLQASTLTVSPAAREFLRRRAVKLLLSLGREGQLPATAPY